MKPEEQLIEKYGKDSGMRVPEGYFADLERNIMQSLPAYNKAERKVDMTRWQRLKPYVYLAAMFCGIWLMMKVFHTATQPISMSLDNPPQALVELLEGENVYEEMYIIPYDGEDFSLSDEELIMSYDNIRDFEKDFYRQ